MRDRDVVEDAVVRARGGDTAAWELLVQEFASTVASVVAGFRVQPADAADLVQNTWASAVARVSDLREPSRFAGWLRQIAYRECLVHYHRIRRDSPSVHDADLPDPTPGPEEQAVTAQRDQALRAALTELGPRRQELLELLFLRGVADYETIASQARMPIGSVGPTRARALRALRTRLLLDGWGPDTRVNHASADHRPGRVARGRTSTVVRDQDRTPAALHGRAGRDAQVDELRDRSVA
ncbi:RNA polymerase sigma factor [Pseudonocardia oroxyli]|uniref:RNA polymerase sigma factor, sigma-70 family n=1 Tax=Pseudonocardia oroxyli TaxID=366584 RepID=A0A1G7XCR6_PSEOR|nr:sigma-70 family RNA polymerase sigma factor [Pseudonocardia oroxyli]SDG82028.1 RNA polymerase sigma factor, sigma-70 family [Pseudonocardia oroxyli]